MNVLVVGGGGREHAIVKKLHESSRVDKIYCAPGNAGISELADCVQIKATDLDGILNFVESRPDIGMTVVAPDDPLAMGLVNRLEESGHRAFGPRSEAAIIESSKAFSKDLMKKYGIPTAAYECFDSYDEAAEYVRSAQYPLVVKADGLALGKGVVICEDCAAALHALDDIMNKRQFGASGNRVVVEEFLTGREVSILAFTDGKTVIPMISSQDHKRALDHDRGLNTGGMGTFAPSKFYTYELAAYCEEHIFRPTVDAMNREDRTFKGVLYFGLMITDSGVKVLEYNARFGDPETQVVLPLLKTDLLDVFDACIDGTLDRLTLEWEDNACVCVILASGGYPQSYPKGLPITIGALEDGVFLYHAGTAFDVDGRLVTSGGRVLGVTAKGKSIAEAREKAYRNVTHISFEGMHYRTDIGIKL